MGGTGYISSHPFTIMMIYISTNIIYIVIIQDLVIREHKLLVYIIKIVPRQEILVLLQYIKVILVTQST